jgi:hypothetical protein
MAIGRDTDRFGGVLPFVGIGAFPPLLPQFKSRMLLCRECILRRGICIICLAG